MRSLRPGTLAGDQNEAGDGAQPRQIWRQLYQLTCRVNRQPISDNREYNHEIDRQVTFTYGTAVYGPFVYVRYLLVCRKFLAPLFLIASQCPLATALFLCSINDVHHLCGLWLIVYLAIFVSELCTYVIHDCDCLAIIFRMRLLSGPEREKWPAIIHLKVYCLLVNVGHYIYSVSQSFQA